MGKVHALRPSTDPDQFLRELADEYEGKLEGVIVILNTKDKIGVTFTEQSAQELIYAINFAANFIQDKVWTELDSKSMDGV